MAAISPRERRLIGLTVLAALLVTGWLFVIEPIRGWNREMAELLPARETVLAKRRGLISRAPAVRRELAETTERADQVRQRLLAPAAPPVAAAELAKIVKDAAVQAGLEVRSERSLSPAARGDLLEIPLEITVSGGMRELAAFLHQLEDARKMLTLQELKIRVLNVSQPRELLTTVTVSGFILPKSPTPKPS